MLPRPLPQSLELSAVKAKRARRSERVVRLRHSMLVQLRGLRRQTPSHPRGSRELQPNPKEVEKVWKKGLAAQLRHSMLEQLRGLHRLTPFLPHGPYESRPSLSPPWSGRSQFPPGSLDSDGLAGSLLPTSNARR